MKKISTNKLLLIIFITITLSISIGILLPAVLSNSNKKIIISTLDNFFISIKNNKINYNSGIISSLSTNMILITIIWILGISIIGSIVILTIIFIKGFIVGFSFSSILISYGFKGIFIGIVYILPLLVNLFIYFILCYYSIDFSLILFNYIFKKRNSIHKKVVKRYIKIYIFSFIFIILSSIVEIYFMPYIIKLLL